MHWQLHRNYRNLRENMLGHTGQHQEEACFKSLLLLLSRSKSPSLVPVYLLVCCTGGHPHCPTSQLKADLSRLSKQGLCCQVCVWVCTPQMCRAACGLDGDLIGRRGFQPRRRVRGWTKTTMVHGRVVEFLTTSTVPVAFHCPTLEKNSDSKNPCEKRSHGNSSWGQTKQNLLCTV